MYSLVIYLLILAFSLFPRAFLRSFCIDTYSALYLVLYISFYLSFLSTFFYFSLLICGAIISPPNIIIRYIVIHHNQRYQDAMINVTRTFQF